MQSEKISKLPPYLFEEIDRVRESLLSSGREVLDLGIGDPDLGATEPLLESLRQSLEIPEYHRYPPGIGLPDLRASILELLKRRYGQSLSENEIIITIGSKEAIGHFPLAVVNPGDSVLIPDPGYPVYYSSAVFAGADACRMPLRKENGYWPDFKELSEEKLSGAALMYLNYPNNPTSRTATGERFDEAVEFCRDREIILANDAAYSDIYYHHPPEVLFPRAREAGIPYIEFFSFSKTLSITGWRIGFAVGSPEEIAALSSLKANIDSGVFGALQRAVSQVLDSCFEEVTGEIREVYRRRREVLKNGLDRAGFNYSAPEATFYFWVEVPGNRNSMDFCRELMEDSGIIATPGIGFGSCGEGYFRLSITADDEIIERAAGRLSAAR